MPDTANLKPLFADKGLKVTPQRLAVYRALQALGHAGADAVAAEVRRMHPTITTATIYNALDDLSSAGVISRLLTTGNRMLFDVNSHEHHHLYNRDESRIADLDDPRLTQLVHDYLAARPIEGFSLENIKIQIIGTFIDT